MTTPPPPYDPLSEYPYGPPPQPPKKNYSVKVLWTVIVIVAVCFLATLVVNIGGSDDSPGLFTSSQKEDPTDPYGLAVALEPTDDPTLTDPATYRRLTEAEFDKAMHPSSDLEEYPYAFVGERVILYGEVDEVGSNFAHARGGTYFEATLSYHDLGPLVSWSLNSEDAPIIGIKADLGDLAHNDEVEIFAEVRRPFLTGEEVFDTPLRKPLLIAHMVRVIR